MKKILTMGVLLSVGAVAPRAYAQEAVLYGIDDNSRDLAQATIAPADTTSVAVGTVFGEMMMQQLDQFGMYGVNVDKAVFIDAFAKVVRGESTGMSFDEANKYMEALFQRLMGPQGGANVCDPAEEQGFIDSFAEAPGSIMTDSGLVFIVLTEGKGATPAADDIVKIKYTGRLSDGTVFDDSGDDAVEIPIAGVIPGFAEGLQMMKPGGTYRILIPSDIGYGPTGIGPIPGNATLDFTITLEGIVPK